MTLTEKLLFGLLALVLLAPLPACNTVEGAGQDIRAAGDAISRTADKTRDEMRR